MKKLYLIFGVILVLIIGVAFVAKNVSAVEGGNQIPFVADVKDNVEKKPPSQEEIYKELKEKALSSVGEGWVYIREYQKYDVDPIPPVEGLIPLTDTITDMWYYINSSGMVERFVTIQRTMDGQIAQVGIYSNGTAWNTMVDEIIPMEPYLFEPFDYGLFYQLKKPELKSEKINKKDGERVVEFKIKNVEKEPVKLLDYSKKLLSMEYQYVFDDATGFIVSVKNIASMEDGTQRDFSNTQIEEIRFNAEPPADVLEYFEIKKNREAQP